MPDPRFHYFERGTRYYRVTLQCDLLGVWVVRREWGSIPRRSMRCLVVAADDYAQALGLVEEAVRRREKRGYEEKG